MSNRVATLLAIPAKSMLAASAVLLLALSALPMGCAQPSSEPPPVPSLTPTLILESDTSGEATSTLTPATGVFTPNVTPGAPAQVTGLAGSTQLDSGVTRLAWNPNPSEDDVLGYRVYRSSVEVVSFQLLAEVPAAVTTYTDETATCGQMYFVTAYNAAGESLPSTSSYFSPPCR